MNDQRAVLDQLQDVIDMATKAGMYDAADWIKDRLVPVQPDPRVAVLQAEVATLEAKNKSLQQGYRDVVEMLARRG